MTYATINTITYRCKYEIAPQLTGAIEYTNCISAVG